jgi:4-hydroxybenzoate polyprenyltransferase
VGPLLASLWREVSTGPTLFYFTALVHAALIVYVAWRISQRVAAPAEERAVFSDVAIAAQTVMPFDPIGTAAAPPEEEAVEGHA